MKIETQPLEDHQVKLTLEVEPEAVETAKQKAARHISQHSKIPGFRPGKAPYKVILRQYGEAAIFEDALEHLVEDLYPKMIEESGIIPYGSGQLEKVVSMNPMVLEFVVPLQAVVTLGDYSGIRVPFEPPQIGQDAVDTILNELRERQAVLEPVERPAQPEDVVEIQIRGERVNPEEGQNPTIIEQMPASILVKTEDAARDLKEWPYPGFSVNFIGKSVGEEFNIEQTLPDDLEFAELRNVTARFTGTIENVKSRTLPELDDEFATMVSDKDNLVDLTEDIRNMLEAQSRQDYFDDYDDKVLDAAVELTEYKYPPQMIENEIDQFMESFKRRLQNEELEFDLYLKARGIDVEGLREEARPEVIKRAKRSLMLFEIALKEDFQVNRKVLNERTSTMISQMTRNLSRKDASKFYESGVFQNVVTNIMTDMLTTRAVEYLRQIASDGAFTMPEDSEPGKVASMQDLLIDGPAPEAQAESEIEATVETEVVGSEPEPEPSEPISESGEEA